MKLLLTRPRAQSERFARETLEALGPQIPVVIAPLIEIVPRPLTVDPSQARGLIFTSENGVTGFSQAEARRHWPVWCVGARTAGAAREAGFRQVTAADGDAAALVARILSDWPAGPLLHLRGAHAAGDVAGRLTAAGLPTTEAVVYDQRSLEFSSEARALLADPAEELLVPLFSPRSARLFGLAADGAAARLHPVAISPAAAGAWAATTVGAEWPAHVADAPDAPAMIVALQVALRAGSAGRGD